MRRPSSSVLALAGLVAVSTAARSLAGLRIDGLWIVPDEMIWAELGRSLWEDGALRVFGETQVFGLVYPALVGAPLTLAGLEAGYDALKVLQALVMSLAAVPVYLWSRRLAGSGWALAAAALTLAIPGLLYSGLVLSEVAFYPVMILVAWAMASALESPTRGRQALLVGAVVLAAATRLQALVLPLVLVTALVFQAVFERDLRRPLRLWPAVAVLGALGVAWVAWQSIAAEALSGALGGYAAAAEAEYDAGDVARFAVYHASELLLAVALFPACAVALLLVRALLGREDSPAVRAYLATALSLGLWLVVQTGAFASVYVNGLSGRYLLPLAPVLFVGFAVWLARGAPRTRLAAGLVAVGALGLLLAVPLRDLVVQEAAWQSPSVIPLIWLREAFGDGGMELVLWGGAAAALAVFALVPRRAAVVMPAVTLTVLAFSSAVATREAVQNIAFDQKNLVGGRHRWIDTRADGSAAYLFVGERPVNFVWHQVFWNERLERVYALAEAPLPRAIPVGVRGDGSLILPGGGKAEQPYVVAVDAVALVGEPIDRVPLASANQSGLTLWRIEAPVRIRSLRTGVREDGDMHEPGRMRVWDCQAGRLELTLLPKASTRVELRVNGETVQVLDDIAGKEFVQAAVSPPSEADVCVFEVVPDSLLGSTRFEFVR